jgi:hypothetical protein
VIKIDHHHSQASYITSHHVTDGTRLRLGRVA